MSARTSVRVCTRFLSVSPRCGSCWPLHSHPAIDLPLVRSSLPALQSQYSVPHRQQHSVSVSTDQAASISSHAHPVGHPWRIVSAVCVQRMPSLSREKLDIEQRYEQLKDTIRAEKSRLSDFELEEAKHMKMKKERQRRALEEDLDVAQATKLEGSDEFEELQEAREAELHAFSPASRETEADKTGDFKSLQRKLDKVLYLLVKKPRREHAWQLPQGGLEEHESLTETAKRELVEECGSELKVDFLSNSPWAFYCYQHPPSQLNSGGFIGTKVFFLKAVYKSGKVNVDNKELVDYKWVTKEELRSFVSVDYYNSIEHMLLE